MERREGESPVVSLPCRRLSDVSYLLDGVRSLHVKVGALDLVGGTDAAALPGGWRLSSRARGTGATAALGTASQDTGEVEGKEQPSV